MNYCIYMHINKFNGKVYIGQTSKKPKERWRNGKGYKNNTLFWNDILKFGWNEGFEHKILKSNLSKEEAFLEESKLIAEYHSSNKNNGYNRTKNTDNIIVNTDIIVFNDNNGILRTKSIVSPKKEALNLNYCFNDKNGILRSVK